MLKTEKTGLSRYFKKDPVASRDEIYKLLRQGIYTTETMLAEVNGAQLCELIPILRGTVWWKKFLIALLRLPPEIWDAHGLIPEYVNDALNPEEKREINELHNSLITDGKQSPLLPFLKSGLKR